MKNVKLEPGFSGLRNMDVPALVRQYGKNQFIAAREHGFIRMVWEIVKEPMFLMLLLACLLYFILGEVKEGLLMLAAMVFVGAISIFQGVKSSKALAALKQFTQPKVTVIRDEKEQTIFSEDLVPGDILLLEEGNSIPADCTIVHANDLSINESIITGESQPVDKSAAEGHNLLFQGTTINSGSCYAIVTAIGNSTVLGKLGKSITAISTSGTLLQNQIAQFVKIMAAIGFITFALIWLVNYLHSGSIIQSLLLGLTIAMAVIPEEIPVAFSSFMALGAFHMSKLGIITRQPLTIENLGAVSVICLDKTGTITENRMEVNSIYDFEKDITEIITPESAIKSDKVLRYARLASEQAAFDAMEKAIIAAYERVPREQAEKEEMIREYPLSGVPPMMTHVYRMNGHLIVAGKGAPERILAVCKMSPAATGKVNAVISSMAAKGLRLLGICSATFTGKDFPELQQNFNWQFEGLLALYDPPKQGIKKEFDQWYAAGIKVKLITGDNKETAMHIAKQVGMQLNGAAITGEQLMTMTSAEIGKIAGEVVVFARMFPEAKLKIIEALKENGETVAMMGDGVNDGPALKSANIGIAMGGRGTEIAREASDLILTDDRLEKVTEAIKQGRKIYYNLKKAVRYIISIHIPIILTASLPLLLGWRFPNIFTPIHVIFLELIMGPTCSIFFEKEPVESSIMIQPPRKESQSIFTAKELLISLIQGFVIAFGILSLYYGFMQSGYTIEYVRTVIFLTLVISNVFLTFVNRSFQENIFTTFRFKNNLVPFVLSASLIFLAGIAFIPFIQRAFQLTRISARDFILCTGVSLIITGWFEVYKTLVKKK
ncbi:cation-translocating P-type ATPase [Chitinophaga sp. LS1]|uniref:cation-translocating P-type ATPase n=1 Tax=Chitinophaga sp. LS1 TaxID=3051176 RepID=UPI002AAA6BF7|nr:cation-translocating P-type ATPase [Chitinophaga sp. LS1]WPV65633.1 cation-translocating P-type ATPase [Chitinophaga sp. LS1]